MDTQSITRLFRSGALKRDAFGDDALRAGNPINMARALNAEILEGRHEGRARNVVPGSSGLSKQLQKRIGRSSAHAKRTSSRGAGEGFDKRQRAIVKIHYFGHGGGGGAALRAHARYVARDGAARGIGAPELDDDSRSHAEYLSKSERGVFYDDKHDGVDGSARAAEWAKRDRRHFRIILAAENASRLKDLKAYTRAVMRRAEAVLGTKLDWVAVDHWDTDNPHTHIILRGRRADGADLVLPREFVQHGMRSAARDVATERLGERTRDDERLALQRETRAHRPTRLDTMLAAQLPANGAIRYADITAPSGAPDVTDALKARARELVRLGLATEAGRNVVTFASDWRERLTAMELHLDVRKRITRERAQLRLPASARPVAKPGRGLLDR